MCVILIKTLVNYSIWSEREFEARIRKLRIFKRSSTVVSASRRRVGSSTAPTPENSIKSKPVGCLTSPISRRELDMLLSGKPRRRRLDDVSTSQELQQEEINYDKRFEEIKEKSGVLDFGIRKYKGVRYGHLIEINSLGEGTCGRVHHCKYEGRSIAVKRMKRTDNIYASKRVFMDLDVVSKCNSPFIIKCIGYFITFEYIDICMEMMMTCFEKVLMRYRHGLPEEVLGKVAYSVVSALDYLKDTHMLMHRDIKPSNILMDVHGHVKLCDFGISGKLIDSKAQTMSKGCTAYLAPERITVDLNASRTYDVRADVWSLGITIAQLARGRFPYHGYHSVFELMIKIYEEPAPALWPEEGYSESLCDFIRDCLRKNMYERPKYKALLKKRFVLDAKQSDYNIARWYKMECMDRPIMPLDDVNLVDMDI